MAWSTLVLVDTGYTGYNSVGAETTRDKLVAVNAHLTDNTRLRGMATRFATV